MRTRVSKKTSTENIDAGPGNEPSTKMMRPKTVEVAQIRFEDRRSALGSLAQKHLLCDEE